MKYVRIQSYFQSKLVAEHLYYGDDHVRAIEAFRKEYPEHDSCIVVASTIEGDSQKWQEYVNVCRRCGLVN